MKKMLLILILIFLNGCLVLSTTPLDNLPFERVEYASQFNGTYKNLGVTNDDAKRHLSYLIWPNEKLDHSSILTIKVEASSNNTLVVKANGVDKIIKEETFVEGKDFKINNEGRILLTKETRMGDGGLAGAYTMFQELGLDQAGHGKLHQTVNAAGLVFLVLPIAMHDDQEVRFERIE